MNAGRSNVAAALVALGFAGVGLYAIVASLEMSMLGAIFPRTIGAILIALSLIQAGLALSGRGGQQSGEGADTSLDGMGRRAALIVTMVAWALLFPVVGFLSTSLAASMALLFIAEHDPPSQRWTLVRFGSVIGMVLVFYWLMVRILNIPMPSGLLF